MQYCEGYADAERSKPYLSQQESDPPEGIELRIDLHANVDSAMHSAMQIWDGASAMLYLCSRRDSHLYFVVQMVPELWIEVLQ
jgi:hypothetical protein